MPQSRAPLWEALLQHRKRQSAQLHVPGHRSGAAIPEDFLNLSGAGIFEIDLTEIPGLDDLHNPEEAIAEAQALAASLYGAEYSCFLVNGTSCGLLALILATCRAGDKILVPRNAHRSVVSGLILSGAMPVYYFPSVIEPFGCLAGTDYGQVELLLCKHSDIRAVLSVRPTYYGVAESLAPLLKLCHLAKVPLLVDEAHGAHLRFHPDLPMDALGIGADAVVQSTHKVGGSLTQSAMLHTKSPLVNFLKVTNALRMVQSTSPSYLLMASLDLARRQLALSGRQLLDRSLDLAHWCRERLTGIKGVTVMSEYHLKHLGAEIDFTRVTFSLQDAGITGYQAAELLNQRHRVVVEMADQVSVVAVISLGTTLEDVKRLVAGVEQLVREKKGRPLAVPMQLRLPEPVVALSPREAWHSTAKAIPLEQARGKVCGETVALYPPGIPVVCPGEKITEAVLEYLLEIRQRQLHIQGPADKSLKSIGVLI